MSRRSVSECSSSGAAASKAPRHLHHARLHARLVGQLALDALGALIQQRAGRQVGATRLARVGDGKEALQEVGHLRGCGGFELGPVALLGQLHGVKADERGDQHEHGGRCGHAGSVALQELARPVAHRVGLGRDGAPVEGALQVVGQLLGGGVAALGLLAQRLQADRVEVALERTLPLWRRPSRRRRGRPFAHDALDLGRGAVRQVERALAGEQLVQHHAQRVHVGRRRHGRALHLLGRGIGGRHHGAARLGEGGVVESVLAAGQHLGDAKVEQLHLSGAGDQDVRRLEVAVHDEPAVRVLDGVAHRADERDALLDRAGVRVAVPVERHAVDVLHGEERLAVVGEAAVEQAGDVRVVQAGKDLALALEALDDRPRRGAPSDELEGNPLLELSIRPLGEEDGAHPATAQRPQDAVRPDALALGRQDAGRQQVSGQGKRLQRDRVEERVRVGVGRE